MPNNEQKHIYEFYYEAPMHYPTSVFRLEIERETSKMFYGNCRRIRYRNDVRDVMCGRFALNKDKIGVATQVSNGYFLVRVISDSYGNAAVNAVNVLRNYFDGWIGSIYAAIFERRDE